jgi:hypothetical protein
MWAAVSVALIQPNGQRYEFSTLVEMMLLKWLKAGAKPLRYGPDWGCANIRPKQFRLGK